MNMQKAALLIVLGIFILTGVVFFTYNEKAPNEGVPGSEQVEIIQKWELPAGLEEVSGIDWLGNNQIAAIQDEDGIIFIYDLESSTIKQEIEFAESGDYEAITLVGTTAYVLRSDGTIYEVQNFRSSDKKTIIHTTPLKSEYNFEGLGFDDKKNQLLLGIKEKSGNESKPVYAFDLNTKKLIMEPVYDIDFKDPVFSKVGKKPSESMLRPSEVSVNKENGNIYFLEAVIPKILILSPDGELLKLHLLNNNQFEQAEGLTFGDSGEIYISNENKRGTGNIMKVKLN